MVDGLTPEQFARDLGAGFPSIHATLAHLVAADAFFLSLCTGEPASSITTGDVPTPAAVRERWQAIEEQRR